MFKLVFKSLQDWQLFWLKFEHYFPVIWVPIIKSHDCRIFIVGIPVQVKQHLYVSPGLNELSHWPLGDFKEILGK